MKRRFGFEQILVVALLSIGFGTALSLAGCGQKGGLFLPRESAAAGRATLPEAIGSTLLGFDNNDGNSPAPALPVPATSVIAPTSAASAPVAPTDPAKRLP